VAARSKAARLLRLWVRILPTVDAGADYPVPYSTTKDSNTTRLSGLSAEIETEADSIKKGEGKRGQLPHSHGWEDGLCAHEERLQMITRTNLALSRTVTKDERDCGSRIPDTRI